MNELQLRPSYWASVSGGKDSLYMLKLILDHLDLYPLDGVVHFELEIDFPFIHDVIDYMESECKKYGIRFVRIKPRKTWEELYHTKNKYGNIRAFPNRFARWCNREYKLDAVKQLKEFLNEQGAYLVSYIGYCADEEKRFAKRQREREIYPLVDFNIEENTILEWARDVPLYNDYYKVVRRCGCMYCPMASRDAMAYLLKYYPQNYQFMIDRIRETEQIRQSEYGRPCAVISGNPKYNADYLDNIIHTKWLPIIEERIRKCKEVTNL